MPRVLPLLAAVSLLPSLASAQTLLSGDHSIDGKLCAGAECTASETFPSAGSLKLKGVSTSIRFEDSTSSGTHPTRDWELYVNDTLAFSSGGIERFSIFDVDADTKPFTIEGSAPENALYVDDAGRVGLGTSIPAEELHVVAAFTPGIRLDQVGGFTPQTWDLAGNENSFFIRDVTHSNLVPFSIETGAGADRLVIGSNGFVGIGTDAPSAPFELSGPNSFNYFRISATGAAVNESVDITFTGGPLGTGQLRYNIVDGDAQEMSLDADGNMVLDGTLTTGGPSCSGGCDAVFTEEQIIPAAEYAAQMWADGHLPHVGPTAPGEAFNMSEKVGGMLNALEHAHIYIEGLHTRLEAQDAVNAALMARLEALEAALAAQ